ncbi:reverse transcriptase domain-containing protein [Tanacetum coccineum]
MILSPAFTKSSQGFDTMALIVDRLTKSAHLLANKGDMTIGQVGNRFVPVRIVADTDTCFKSSVIVNREFHIKLLEISFQKAVGYRSGYVAPRHHPEQTNGSERGTIQTLEDMLQIQVLRTSTNRATHNLKRKRGVRVGDMVMLKVLKLLKGLYNSVMRGKLNPRIRSDLSRCEQGWKVAFIGLELPQEVLRQFVKSPLKSWNGDQTIKAKPDTIG